MTAGAIAERVRWQLDGWLSSGAATAGLTLLRLTPDEVKPDHGRQLGFWGGSAAADDRAARALARIQGMLGPEGVVTAVVGGGRDPAGQVRLVPWGDPREPGLARPSRGVARLIPPARAVPADHGGGRRRDPALARSSAPAGAGGGAPRSVAAELARRRGPVGGGVGRGELSGPGVAGRGRRPPAG